MIKETPFMSLLVVADKSQSIGPGQGRPCLIVPCQPDPTS